MRTILERTLTCGLLVTATVVAVPGAATAAPRPQCRVSGPATVGEQLGIADSAWLVNNHGDVVGAYSTSQFDQHSYYSREGSAQEVGWLAGAEQSHPEAFTDSGYILGTTAGPGGLRAPSYLWRDGTQIDLSDAVEPNFPHLPDVGVEPYVQGSVVNESGLVAGYESDRAITYAVTWSQGTLTRIPSLGGTDPSEPAAVNDTGLVAVNARLSGNAVLHAAIWDGTTLHDLGTLGGDDSMASDLNAAGHVAGQSSTAAGATHPFLYRDGQLIDLGLPVGAVWASADFVNDRDQVVGKWRGEDGQSRVFVWDRGRFTDLGPRTVARGINARGQVIGYQADADDVATGTAFVWTGGTRVDLRGLFLGGMADVQAINDHGEVVGWARTAAGVQRSVRWAVSCVR